MSLVKPVRIIHFLRGKRSFFNRINGYIRLTHFLLADKDNRPQSRSMYCNLAEESLPDIVQTRDRPCSVSAGSQQSKARSVHSGLLTNPLNVLDPSNIRGTRIVEMLKLQLSQIVYYSLSGSVNCILDKQQIEICML